MTDEKLQLRFQELDNTKWKAIVFTTEMRLKIGTSYTNSHNSNFLYIRLY